MPPKPFNPPRPSAASKTTAKGPRKSTGKTNSAVSKSKPKPKPKSVSNRPRISSPRPPHLPSLSPDPSASEHSPDDDDQDDQETNSRSEPESDQESIHNSDSSSLPSQPALPKNPPPRRRKSHNSTAPLNIPSSSLNAQNNNDNTQDPEAILSPRAEHIPAPLLSALLHTFLAEQGHAGTRIKKDANAAVGKYVDTFVREAIARAAWVREEGSGEGGDVFGGGGGGGGDRSFLEVEDLERLAPQLLMDF